MKKHKHEYGIYKDVADFQQRNLKGSLVFTNGCFDILHDGHFTCLEESKRLGDILVVGLNSDRSVKKLKGCERPIHNWQSRANALASLSYVDAVIYFDEDTPIRLIKALRPDFVTKGGDYRREQMIGGEFVESYGGTVVILPYLEGFSTTNIISGK